MSNPTLSLIIPALNESEIILQNTSELKAWMAKNLADITFEIVVINDGSTDGMGELLETESSGDPHLRVVHHKTNMGRGRAVRTGMEHTNSDYVIALDADLSYSADHIKPMLESLVNDKAELSLASPYHPDGIVKNVPMLRAKLSKWGNWVLCRSFKTKINTSTCVVRGYTRKLIEHLELINDGKDFHLEVLYKTELLGFKIVEIPASLIWRDRNRGKSNKGQGNIISNNPLFKMRGAIFSHLIFNFFSRPHFLFLGPILFFFCLATYGSFSLLSVFIDNIRNGNVDPLRTTLIEGGLTLTMTMSSYVLLFAFTFFLFVASQIKKYFEEQYIMSSRSNYRTKQIQKSLQGGG